MRKIKDLVATASTAVRLMTKGLRNPINICVDMATYGEALNTICFGCAATCTIQQLMPRAFEATDMINRQCSWSQLGNMDVSDIEEFETAIDMFRKGVPFVLLKYYNVEEKWGGSAMPRLPKLYESYTEDIRMSNVY